MSRSGAVQPPLSFVLRLFPDATAVVRRLYLANDEFRGICEDYALACTSLERLKAVATPRPDEIDDYRAVLEDLERELSFYIEGPRDPLTRDGSRS